MWATARLKKDIAATDTYFQLADNLGFDQVMVGDVIIMNRVRNPEQMIVEGFDEDNKLLLVQRGYNSTTATKWKKGSKMRIFRIMNAPATTEAVYEDVENLDGQTTEQLADTYLIYEWQSQDTCLPGCFYLEFKLLKMKAPQYFLPGGKWVGTINIAANGDYYTGSSQTDSSVKVSVQIPNPTQPNQTEYALPSNVHWTGPIHLWTDSNYYTGTTHNDGSVYLDTNGVASPNETSYNENGVVSAMCVTCDDTPSIVPTFTDPDLTPSDFGCDLGIGVEWIQRFPLSGEGFLIQIIDSPTAE
jgi:hypothetical protein